MDSDDINQRLWALAGLLGPDAPDGPAPTTADLLKRRASRRPDPARQPSRLWIRRGAVAAGVVGAFGAGWGLRPRPKPPVEPARHLTMAEYTTGPTESASVTLGDSSVVRLAPKSRLRVVASATERVVWLHGRALFAVAKQPRRFVVRTTAGEAIALGTRFQLTAEGDDLELLVVEGRVALSTDAARVEVADHQAATVRGRRLTGAPRQTDPEKSLAWVGNFVVFQATPLADAARELARRYQVEVRVLDSTLGFETVTGAFENEPLDDVLKVLCRSVGARCAVGRTGATIEP